MELLIKQILPIILLVYLVCFEAKRNKEIFLTIILFWAYVSFSSNYSVAIYRPLYQFVQIVLIVVYFIGDKANLLKSQTNKVLLLYLLFILLSGIRNISDGDEYWGSIVNFSIIIIVVAFLNKSVNNLKKLYKLLAFIKRLSFLLSIAGIIAFGVIRSRIELTTSNTNYLAYFLGVGFCLCLFLPEPKKNRLVLVVVALGILCTSSRIVIISSLLVSAYYLISNSKKIFINILVVAAAVIIAIALNLFQFIDQKRFTEADQDVSTILRVEIIEASKKLVAENPYNGIGYGQFKYKFLGYASKTSQYLSDQEEIVTHNDFIRVIDELGVPAFLLFIYIIITQFITLWKLPLVYKRLVFSLFVTNILYSTAHNNLNTFLFWFLLTMPTMVKVLLLKQKHVKAIR